MYHFRKIITCILHVTFQEVVEEGPVAWASKENLSFIAEQVSHHPPSMFTVYMYICTMYNKILTACFNLFVVEP